MVLDIVVGVLVLLFGYFGSRTGAGAQLYQLGIIGGAAVAAKLMAPSTANFITHGVGWAPYLSLGLSYTVMLGLLVMAGYFLLSGTIAGSRDNFLGGTLESAVGALFGAARGAVLMFALICGVILVTMHMGSRKSMFAVQYQKSRVGKFVLTHNVVDTQPFPHANVLKMVVGAEEVPEGTKNPYAISSIRENPKAKFLLTDMDVGSLISNGSWKQLRRDPRLLELVCDHHFLQAVRELTTPDLKAEAENPEDRFEELRGK